MNTQKTPKKQKSQQTSENLNDQSQFLQRLVAFYWKILEDPDLKPSDRIASAKRLEALVVETNQQQGPHVTVILNLPEMKP